MNRRLLALMTMITGALILAAVAIWLPQAAAEAQCGSQASSCKNCHEVQNKKPVNNDGTSWHQSHAFGDFCANCHAGNVQAIDETTAHAGMVAPLSDIKANCAACHPSDTLARAQVYAATLHVQVGGGTSGGLNTTGTGSNTPATLAPTATNPPASSNQVVNGLVDYNQQYAQTVQGQLPINWGNLIAGALILVLAVGGGAFVVFNERKLRGGLALHPAEVPTTKPAASTEAAATATPKVMGKPSLAARQAVTARANHPEATQNLDDLVAQLQKLDPPALRALRRLLADPAAASELLVSLSRIDPRLIEAVRHLDHRELNLLMALAAEPREH